MHPSRRVVRIQGEVLLPVIPSPLALEQQLDVLTKEAPVTLVTGASFM